MERKEWRNASSFLSNFSTVGIWQKLLVAYYDLVSPSSLLTELQFCWR